MQTVVASGGTMDANGNGVPDECDCPVFQPIHTNAKPSIKNRYISFTPRVSYWTPMTAFIDPPLVGKRAAIRVKLVDLDRFPQLNGQVRWVGPPNTHPDALTPFGEFIAAELQCEPHYQDWGYAEYMHVFGSAIVPGSTYEVQIVAESCTGQLLDESKFSPPVTIVTRQWGDVFEPYGGLSQPNFGSVFTNPPGHHAGALVEQVGLKGLRSGNAQISTLHANWIVSLGGAMARDVVALMELMQARVLEATGVVLTPEVKRVGLFT